MRFLLRLLISALALWVAVHLLDGIRYEGGLARLLGVALIFGIVNALIRPIILLLSCPLIVATLGLGVFLINGAMLLVTAWLSRYVGLGFHVDGFVAAILGSIVIGVVSLVMSVFVPGKGEERREKRE